jgi:hypothetical protein
MTSFAGRVIGAMKLDAAIYEEVEADEKALFQSAAVVLLASVAVGIGMARYVGPMGVFYASIGALLGWIAWAILTWVIGTRLLPEPQTSADLGQLLRTIGFASAPGLLQVFAFVPVAGFFLLLIVAIWLLMAMVVAVRCALDYKSLPRAVAVVAIGWIVHLIIRLLMAPTLRPY